MWNWGNTCLHVFSIKSFVLPWRLCALEASQSALGVSVSSESFRRSAVAELPRLMVLHLEPSFEAKTLHALAYGWHGSA